MILGFLSLAAAFAGLSAYADCTCSYNCIAVSGNEVLVSPHAIRQSTCSLAAAKVSCGTDDYGNHYFPVSEYQSSEDQSGVHYISEMRVVQGSDCVSD